MQISQSCVIREMYFAIEALFLQTSIEYTHDLPGYLKTLHFILRVNLCVLHDACSKHTKPLE